MDMPVHIMAKPAGPACNLDCNYCFYTEKEALFDCGSKRMSDDVLKAYTIANCGQSPEEIIFAWQGGEPTLLGIDFFKRALALQSQYANGKRITNTIQTNGTLLDDEWCSFLAENDFLVGLSLDGPDWIHDRYRVDRQGKPTHARVMKALGRLKKHGAEYNVLACVNKLSSKHPDEVYTFFKEAGVQHIQFIPIVERVPDQATRDLGLKLGMPGDGGSREVTEWTAPPEAYGDFLISVFDSWVRNDVGNIFVMNFEWALSTWMGYEAPTCRFAPRCGRSFIMECNGDIYACDHYVYPEYRLGNIQSDSLATMACAGAQISFGAAKEERLPGSCRQCEWLTHCRGGCPKHRFTATPNDDHNLNYLCPGYKKYFSHINKYMNIMKKLTFVGQPASRIMDVIRGPVAVVTE